MTDRRESRAPSLAPLMHEEVISLASHEAVLERGLATFVEVGDALQTIKLNRLYRMHYETFEDYCRERWGIGRDRR